MRRLRSRAYLEVAAHGRRTKMFICIALIAVHVQGSPGLISNHQFSLVEAIRATALRLAPSPRTLTESDRDYIARIVRSTKWPPRNTVRSIAKQLDTIEKESTFDTDPYNRLITATGLVCAAWNALNGEYQTVDWESNLGCPDPYASLLVGIAGPRPTGYVSYNWPWRIGLRGKFDLCPVFYSFGPQSGPAGRYMISWAQVSKPVGHEAPIVEVRLTKLPEMKETTIMPKEAADLLAQFSELVKYRSEDIELGMVRAMETRISRNTAGPGLLRTWAALNEYLFEIPASKMTFFDQFSDGELRFRPVFGAVSAKNSANPVKALGDWMVTYNRRLFKQATPLVTARKRSDSQ